MKLNDIMERWAAGDWNKDPDGGVCRAILESYNAGITAAAQRVGASAEHLSVYSYTKMILELRRICLWTGKDDEGSTRYCHELPGHEGPHRDTVGFEWTEGTPHPRSPIGGEL